MAFNKVTAVSVTSLLALLALLGVHLSTPARPEPILHDMHGVKRHLQTGPRFSTDFFTRQTFRNQFNTTAWAYDYSSFAPSSGPGGALRLASAANVPPLFGTDVAMATLTLEPCGTNLPHVHPRGTEIAYVVEGQNITVSFVEENGGRVVTNVISRDQGTFFEKGLVHLQYNNNCAPAKLVVAFSSADPGTLTISTQAFGKLPVDVVAAALNLPVDTYSALIGGFPGNPAAIQSCRKRCGLA